MVDFTVDGENDGEIVLEDSETAVFDTNETTPLISLKERRKQIVNDLYTDIKVPRWDDPEIFVRFKPVSATKFAATMERRRKSKSTDWTFLANVDMIVDSCVGVYCLMEGNERKFSLRLEDHHGEWTKFDPDLAKALGIEAERAADVCKGLYLTEGDLIDTANKLFRWSGLAQDEADEAF